MKIPASLLQLAYKIATNNIGSIAAKPLQEIPHVGVIAKAYNDNQPLEVIIGLYLQATENVKDDEIAGKVGEVLEFVDTKIPAILADLSKRPFKDVLGDLLGELSVPDFDDEKGNEKKVIELINKVFEALQ